MGCVVKQIYSEFARIFAAKREKGNY